MGKYFGTDGFRGEANKKLTVEHAYKVGRFLGHYYGLFHNNVLKIFLPYKHALLSAFYLLLHESRLFQNTYPSFPPI